MDFEKLKSSIFNIATFNEFNTVALQIYYFQYQHNALYRKFVDLLPVKFKEITSCYDIPCLPVGFYKTHEICSISSPPELIFKSSGTSSGTQSRSLVFSKTLYEKSILKSFSSFWGNPEDYTILALVPDYKTAQDSSLAFMLDFLIRKSGHRQSGFYMNNYDELKKILFDGSDRKKILFGITYALMDFATKHSSGLKNTIIIETGGMKGRRKEITREELHDFLRNKLGISRIYSEYSMCELMSQAYSSGESYYTPPPWMKVFIRELNDPLTTVRNEKSGGINIIDLANMHTCSFVSTQDIGIVLENGTFDVLGRFDYSDVRGCSLLG
ncbi:MAG TPA: acyltransferase [Bacteroidales bacterium]|nr:acyltransferase [Bacteroidales bacterium]